MSEQRWRCNCCGHKLMSSQMLLAQNPFNPEDEIVGCPKCKVVDDFTNICDEPGCDADAGCGWPTPDGGYRRTCGKHWRHA